MEFRPYLKNKKTGERRISERCKECQKEWSEDTKHHAKELCCLCYNRLNRRLTYSKPLEREKIKKYVAKERERINKYPREYYLKNKDKAIKRMVDGQKYKGLKKKCQSCNSEQNLEIHHLDYYSKNNFEILCIKCHRRIHRK